MNSSRQIATFASGCFWCTEAVFMRLRGVAKVTSGYAGGSMDNPSYEDVSSGRTGHVESIQVEFDPAVIPYERLLDVFFATHDPTTKDRQGADVGSQYRSAIFFHNEGQRKAAKEFVARLEKDGTFGKPIVTEILLFQRFFPAEEYHQDYYAKNSDASYCQVVIDPKIAKLRQKFAPYLKHKA